MTIQTGNPDTSVRKEWSRAALVAIIATSVAFMSAMGIASENPEELWVVLFTPDSEDVTAEGFSVFMELHPVFGLELTAEDYATTLDSYLSEQLDEYEGITIQENEDGSATQQLDFVAQFSEEISLGSLAELITEAFESIGGANVTTPQGERFTESDDTSS